MTPGVAGVLSRIQEIRGELGLSPAPGAVLADGTLRTAPDDDNSFATALRGAAGIAPRSSGVNELAEGLSGVDVVTSAKKYLGTPYVFGSTDPGRGLDCSALVQRAYRDLGIELPRTAAEQARAGQAVASLADARPGDVLCFDSPVDHVGIYLGGNQMIAAPKPGDHVKIQPVVNRPTTIRRIVADVSAYDPAAALRPVGLRQDGALGAIPYADLFTRAGAKYGVAPRLLAAVAKVESGYDPSAISGSGAQGLMQLMPGTARELGVTDAFDPVQAIEGGARLLAANLREFKSVPLALAAYNAGGGAVRRFGGIPPAKQTQAYVPKVQRALAALGG